MAYQNPSVGPRPTQPFSFVQYVLGFTRGTRSVAPPPMPSTPAAPVPVVAPPLPAVSAARLPVAATHTRPHPQRASSSRLPSHSRDDVMRMNHELVARYFPDFKLHPEASLPYYEGGYTTASSQHFQFRLVLPPGSPDTKPLLYVWAPIRLAKWGGGTVNSVGCSHAFHTLENGPGGKIQLCHDPSWHAAKTYVGVLARAIWWAEAYCQHIKKGKNISAYFS